MQDDVEREVDSGFTPENIADAEGLVANMPGLRRFHNMATYERAMACHTAARFRTAAISAMTPDTDYDRGWNAAIEATKWAVVGYIHPDHGRLPGEAFASAQIDKLKKPTGNLAPTTKV